VVWLSAANSCSAAVHALPRALPLSGHALYKTGACRYCRAHLQAGVICGSRSVAAFCPADIAADIPAAMRRSGCLQTGRVHPAAAACFLPAVCPLFARCIFPQLSAVSRHTPAFIFLPQNRPRCIAVFLCPHAVPHRYTALLRCAFLRVSVHVCPFAGGIIPLRNVCVSCFAAFLRAFCCVQPSRFSLRQPVALMYRFHCLV